MKYSCSEHPCSEHHFPKLLAQNFRALNIPAQSQETLAQIILAPNIPAQCQNTLAQIILAPNIPAQNQNTLAQKILAQKVQQQYKFINQLLLEICLILNLDYLLRICNDTVDFSTKTSC
jgi:hypothetical protein